MSTVTLCPYRMEKPKNKYIVKNDDGFYCEFTDLNVANVVLTELNNLVNQLRQTSKRHSRHYD